MAFLTLHHTKLIEEERCKRYDLILVIREICTIDNQGYSPLLAIVRIFYIILRIIVKK